MKGKTIEKKKRSATKAGKKVSLEGYLFSKLHALGSRSEGPLYYLQLKSGKEIPVEKKVWPWQNDPVLHGCLGQKVAIRGLYRRREGMPGGTILQYEKLLNAAHPLQIDIQLGLKDETLWVDKMPGPPAPFPPEEQKVSLKLMAHWPYREDDKERSIWTGECPTSQLYDFWIEDPGGRTIWQWSRCLSFLDEPTSVLIPGGSLKTVQAAWPFFEDAITKEGVYVAAARFIASSQEVRKGFGVEFAY